MSFSLNTNAASMNIVANLALSQTAMHKAMERVSSGVRVINAADDAAGMALHTVLGSQIKGLQAATRNAQDGVSVLQTADGALQEITNLLQRAYQVALNIGNDATLTGDALQGAYDELDGIGTAITFIHDNTSWGALETTDNVFDTNIGGAFQAGLDSSTGIYDSGLTLSYTDPGIDHDSVVSDVATALSAAMASRTAIGGQQAGLEGIIASNTTAIANLQASDSRVADTDMAFEISNVTRLNILGQAGTAMLAQANQNNLNVLQLLK